MDKKFQFNFNDKTYQIRFSFPDKWNGIYRRYTMAWLYEKVVNPEDNKDFVWKEIDVVEAKCNIDIHMTEYGYLYNYGDKFDKYTGKKIAFTKLINQNFDREFRKELWEQFFKLYGKKVTIRKDIIIQEVAVS